MSTSCWNIKDSCFIDDIILGLAIHAIFLMFQIFNHEETLEEASLADATLHENLSPYTDE